MSKRSRFPRNIAARRMVVIARLEKKKELNEREQKELTTLKEKVQVAT